MVRAIVGSRKGTYREWRRTVNREIMRRTNVLGVPNEAAIVRLVGATPTSGPPPGVA